VVRDGRDVACSVADRFWGPNDVDEALDWWANRLEHGLAACDRLPADRVILVRMEELVAGDREREYRRLLEFLGIDDDPAMRQYFETTVAPGHAHIGRWMEQVPPERREAFEAHHAALLEGMRSRGRALPEFVRAEAEGQAG
jgi:Sulfotransferase family